jgi:hypothetical protein
LDGVASITYLGVLIPIWAVEVGELHLSGFGLLVGYCTAPMIVNMWVQFPLLLCYDFFAHANRLIHFYIFVFNARSIWASYGGLQVHECPNCHNNFTVGARKVQETSQSGERHSLLRGEDYLDPDADAEHYIHASARPSEETMRPEGDEVDGKEGKGKMIIEI